MKKCEHCETTAVVVRTVKDELDECREERDNEHRQSEYRRLALDGYNNRIHQLEAERDQAQAIVEVRDAVNVWEAWVSMSSNSALCWNFRNKAT